MALLLQQADCTVTVCHSATRDLKAHTQRADLVIAAAGRPRFLGPEFFRDGAVVVDVGIHRLGRGADGKEQLCGDVDFDRVKGAVAALTPVPGGVGPMTIAMLLWNAVECADQLVSGARQ
jgi:methylenetetrahydrofolate dehydrogenase (NADP+)/methenyltetrahydrofolate cyclohydrolase